jgi:protein-glutamine gamma-glutamyltransferase
LNPRTRELAQQWRSEGLNDAQIIQRSLDWFNKEFSYSLDAPLLGRNGVDQFLFDSKIGYCEYFSSSFVVLMREAGIPSRVVTGYAGGIYNRVGEYWMVRNSDAHAWAEVWLPNRGWARVDPTAAVAPERVFETVEDLRNATDSGFEFSDAFNYADWLSMAWNDWMLGFNADRQRRLLSFGNENWSNSTIVLMIAIGFSIALAISIWFLMRERDSSRNALLKAWDRACKRWEKHGFKRALNETALAFAQRAHEQSRLDNSFQQLAIEFNQLRYAAPSEDISKQIDAFIQRLRAFRIQAS